MPPTTEHPVPILYRLIFLYIDPIMSLFGVIMHLQPTLILPNYSLSPLLPPATETRLLLDALAGFFAALAFLQAVLLRVAGRDVRVWKVLQGATVLVDVSMVLAFGRALEGTGRLDVAGWRVEEWTNIGINGGLAIVRLLFVLGVGLGKAKTS